MNNYTIKFITSASVGIIILSGKNVCLSNIVGYPHESTHEKARVFVMLTNGEKIEIAEVIRADWMEANRSYDINSDDNQTAYLNACIEIFTAEIAKIEDAKMKWEQAKFSKTSEAMELARSIVLSVNIEKLIDNNNFEIQQRTIDPFLCHDRGISFSRNAQAENLVLNASEHGEQDTELAWHYSPNATFPGFKPNDILDDINEACRLARAAALIEAYAIINGKAS